MARAGAVAGAIDPALRMLDAHADREGLGFDVDAARVQHFEGRARAVADGQYDLVGLEKAAVVEMKAAQAAFRIKLDVVDPCLPAVLAAEALDRRPEAFD